MVERGREEERLIHAALAPDRVLFPGSSKAISLLSHPPLKETSIFIQLYSKLKPQKYRLNVQARKEMARKEKKN